jgi:PAS domain S-box-containing protein
MSTTLNSLQISRFFFFFFLATFGLVFEGYSESSPSNNNLEEVTLQLKWKHQFQFAGYYAALEKGFYRQAGLDVKIVEATNGEDSTSQVISGKADFGIAMSDLIEKRAKGQPVVALASIFQHSPLIILSLRKSGIENIHDLIGKKISLEAHSEQILSYLSSEGLPSRKLNIYPHDYDVTKLIRGEIDAMSAYSTDEPFLLLSKGFKYSTFSPRAGGIDFYGDTLFTTEFQINEHPERVAAFLKASLKGWKYALDNTEEIVDLILSKYTSRHSREHLLFEAQMSRRLIMADVVELGYMNPGRWLHIAKSFMALNRIPNDFSLEGFVYNQKPARDHRFLYLSIFAVFAIAGIAFLLVSRFHRMNLLLKTEISRRKEADEVVKTSLKEKEILLHDLEKEITEHNLKERALEESEERFKAIFDKMVDGILVADTSTRKFTMANNSMSKLLGYEIDELKNLSVNDIHPPEDLAYVIDAFAKQARKEFLTAENIPVKKKDGTVFFADINSTPIKLSGQEYLVGIFRDVTSRKKNEEKIKSSLKEKEILLQEIHHRVKNNMQVVASLLDLQSSIIEDKQVTQVLKESQSRVHTMSIVHEALHDSDSLSEIDLQTYLFKLTTSIFQTYSVEPGKVSLNNEIENIPISINQASPLGLIVNELISNSLKYAFPDDRTGEISVSMKEISNELELIVSDDGIGIPEDLDWRNLNSLGLKLVRSLAEDQLGGSVEMESSHGTKFIIKFNIEA